MVSTPLSLSYDAGLGPQVEAGVALDVRDAKYTGRASSGNRVRVNLRHKHEARLLGRGEHSGDWCGEGASCLLGSAHSRNSRLSASPAPPMIGSPELSRGAQKKK